MKNQIASNLKVIQNLTAESFTHLIGVGASVQTTTKTSKKNGGQKVWRCGRIRAFRNYLIALDMVESGVELPQRVRWSNVSFVNELPPDWVEDDDKRDGGFNDLTDSIGIELDDNYFDIGVNRIKAHIESNNMNVDLEIKE